MAPAFFDTHCHLQDPRFGDDLGPVLARARQGSVTHMVCCGTREADWGSVLELAQRHLSIIPMLGLHPWYAREADSGWLDRLEAFARTERAGIGECGLDFAMENPDRGLQESVFRSQLRLACTHNRPISIHCRRAWERLAAMAREEGLPRAGAVIHAFSGSAEMALELQGIGFNLAFGGSLTNPENVRAAKAVKVVAGDRLLFETDAPDMPPHRFSGGQGSTLNEPANIDWVAKAASRLRCTDLSDLTTQVSKNSERIFGGLRP